MFGLTKPITYLPDTFSDNLQYWFEDILACIEHLIKHKVTFIHFNSIHFNSVQSKCKVVKVSPGGSWGQAEALLSAISSDKLFNLWYPHYWICIHRMAKEWF